MIVAAKKKIRQGALVAVGCLLYALSYSLFLEPFRISPGGVSGIAMVIGYITGFPAGIGIIIINIPLIILAFVRLGGNFIISTAAATFLSSVLIDLTAHMSTPVKEPILAAICGGVIMGIGLGFILKMGVTTGGTDIVSKLLQDANPHLKMGQIVMAVDGTVVCLSSIVFKDFSLVVYALIGLVLCGKVIDAILYGFDIATLTYTISDKHLEIGNALQKRLGRGITYIEAQGGYALKSKKVIVCAIKRGQVAALRDIIEDIDPTAFLIITEGHQVFGDGFNSN